MSEPRIGQIVHYVSYGTPGGEYTSTCRAAVVSQSYSDTTVNLVVLNPTGLFFNSSSMLDKDTKQGGTWHRLEDCDE